MGKDMSLYDNPMGFQIYGELLRANWYVIDDAPTIPFYHGQMVHMLAGAGQTLLSPKMGYMPLLADDAVITTSDYPLGAIIGITDVNMNPVKYMAALDAGNGTISGHALVADHPLQLFLAQEDATDNAITAVEGQCNAQIYDPGTGDNNTGISDQEIDSSSAVSTSTFLLRLLRPHPDDTAHVDGTWCRYICMINSHQYGNVGQTSPTTSG